MRAVVVGCMRRTHTGGVLARGQLLLSSFGLLSSQPGHLQPRARAQMRPPMAQATMRACSGPCGQPARWPLRVTPAARWRAGRHLGAPGDSQAPQGTAWARLQRPGRARCSGTAWPPRLHDGWHAPATPHAAAADALACPRHLPMAPRRKPACCSPATPRRTAAASAGQAAVVPAI
jgi:hypothetical protein